MPARRNRGTREMRIDQRKLREDKWLPRMKILVERGINTGGDRRMIVITAICVVHELSYVLELN